MLDQQPVCASLEPLTGEFADWMRESYGPTLAFLFKRGDAQWVSLERLMFHWTVKVGDVDDYWTGYTDRYCYQDPKVALVEVAAWADRNWEGEPSGWHRHPPTGRRRDLETGREWVEG